MPARISKLSRSAAAVVTGAGSGIGRSFALEIGRRGGAVLCVDVDAASAEATATALRDTGSHALAYTCDVSSEEQMAKLADAAAGLLQRPVTLLINNAGVGAGGRVGEVTLEDWRWCLGVNLWGVIHGCHFFAPQLRTLGYGGIINVASAAGFAALPELAAYNAGKAAVMSLSETLAAELSPYGVKVNVLCPTVVPTRIFEASRLPGGMSSFAMKAKKWLALTDSDSVARKSLEALDRGHLYTLPQPDGRLIWSIKRHLPATYSRLVSAGYGLTGR